LDNRDSAEGPSSVQPPGIWHLGDAVLDEQQARLSVGGTVAELDRSSQDVLLALLRHAGEVVTKEELLEAGWPGRVVSENSLAKAIGRLRRALGPEGACVRAVHGYGYRLSARVRFRPAADGGVPARADADPGLLEMRFPALRPGWKLLRKLGEGGTGTTFLARTGDGEERVIKFATSEAGFRGLKREMVLSRYVEAVRAPLPDVARVLGSNLGQPPFFLELPYFDEGHLGEWAARPEGLPSLAGGKRIALCAQLCDAVAALHEIGVIHRDLKPENLYPRRDASGEWHIVLADLGAGEAVQASRLVDLGITLTMPAGQLSERAGSLLYVAPEVIAGEMPTQRSDVFALGVLVYQLLCGDLRRSLAPGWETDIGDELLRRDIALAAAASAERRLPSARELAERLRRIDDRRAQLAQERELERRQAETRRLLERHRTRRPWLIATAAVLALGIATSSWLYLEALAAGRDAQQSAAVADAVNRFFNQDVLGAASPYAHGIGEPTIREAIDRAAANIDTRLAGQPVVEATVRLAIGQVYGESMQIAQAIEQKRRAVALFRQHLGPADPRTQQAQYLLASDLADDSRFEEAKALIDSTDATRAQLRLDDLDTALVAHRAGCYWHIRREQYDAGQAACEGAVTAQLALDAGDHTALVKARANLAVLHSRAGRAGLAEEQFAELDKAFAALGDDDSPTRLRTLFLHGMNLLALDRHDEAAQALEAAHRGSAAALGPHNPHTLEVQMGLARLHLRRSRPGDAIPLLREAHAAYARQLGEENHYTLEAGRELDAALCALSGNAPAPDTARGACPVDATPSEPDRPQA